MHRYRTWRSAVEAILYTRFGVYSPGMSPRPWDDLFEAGATPEQAVDRLCGRTGQEFWARELR